MLSMSHVADKIMVVTGSPYGDRPSLALLGTALRASKKRSRFLSNQWARAATHSDNKTAPLGGCFAGGEGGIVAGSPYGDRPSLALLGTALRASKKRARFLSNQWVRAATRSDNKTAPLGGCFAGGEGGIRTHVPGKPDHLISSQRRYDHFGTSPERVVFYQPYPGRRTCRLFCANSYAET
jgi:hypothetical protein